MSVSHSQKSQVGKSMEHSFVDSDGKSFSVKKSAVCWGSNLEWSYIDYTMSGISQDNRAYNLAPIENSWVWVKSYEFNLMGNYLFVS